MSSTYPSPLRSLNYVLERVDQVLAAQGHDRFRHVLIELAIDAEAADAAEPIAIFVERIFPGRASWPCLPAADCRDERRA